MPRPHPGAVSPPSLLPPAYLPECGPASGLRGPVLPVVHGPRPQGAAGIEVHGVGLLPGNVPQGHGRLGQENRTATLGNLFLRLLTDFSPHQFHEEGRMVPTRRKETRGSERLRDLPRAQGLWSLESDPGTSAQPSHSVRPLP